MCDDKDRFVANSQIGINLLRVELKRDTANVSLVIYFMLVVDCTAPISVTIVKRNK